MSKFEKVKSYFEKCLWDTNRVHNAVVKGWISVEEYKIITGEDYEED